MKTKTLSISISCAPQKVYNFVSNLENFPKWVKFCRSIKKSKMGWVMETLQGRMKIRIAAKNKLGVLDHYITDNSGVEVFVPMRVVPSLSGSEMTFTLFQMPNMLDKNYIKDIELVKKDLASLKNIMEVKK